VIVDDAGDAGRILSCVKLINFWHHFFSSIHDWTPLEDSIAYDVIGRCINHTLVNRAGDALDHPARYSTRKTMGCSNRVVELKIKILLHTVGGY
jgi:hypothetical protein